MLRKCQVTPLQGGVARGSNTTLTSLDSHVGRITETTSCSFRVSGTSVREEGALTDSRTLPSLSSTRLVAVINTKLPEVGELLLKRVIFSFRRAYKRRDKIVATALVKFIGQLVNQQVRGLCIGELQRYRPTVDSTLTLQAHCAPLMKGGRGGGRSCDLRARFNPSTLALFSILTNPNPNTNVGRWPTRS